MSERNEQPASASPAAPAPSARRERWAKFALLALIALLPLVYVPRVLFGAGGDGPQPSPPKWMDVVVISVGRQAPIDFERAPERLRLLARRGSLIRDLWSTSPEPGAAAASLWTGRFARSHGALGGARLAEPAWTLASSLRAGGAATAACLDEPLASRAGIAGFDALDEQLASPEAVGRAGADFLDAHRGQRCLVWLHLAVADAEQLEQLLAALEPALERDGRRFETLLALVGLGTRTPQGAFDARCPAVIALPAASFGGRQSQSTLSLADLAGTLATVIETQLPDEHARESACASRVQSLWAAVRGTDGAEPVLVQTPEADDCYLPPPGRNVRQLARVHARAGAPEAEYEVWIPGPGGAEQRATGELRTALIAQYRMFLGQLR